MRNRQQLNVAITGMHGEPKGRGSGLAVARCLRESMGDNVRLIGLGQDSAQASAYFDDVCDAAYVLAPPLESWDQLLESLVDINCVEDIDVLIPCRAEELPLVVALAGPLDILGIRTALPGHEGLQRALSFAGKMTGRHAGGEEFKLAALGNGMGGLLGKPVILRDGIPCDDAGIMQLARRLAGELQWKGPFSITVQRLSARPDQLVEFLPCFPQWLAPFHSSGRDLPLLLLDLALDRFGTDQLVIEGDTWISPLPRADYRHQPYRVVSVNIEHDGR